MKTNKIKTRLLSAKFPTLEEAQHAISIVWPTGKDSCMDGKKYIEECTYAAVKAKEGHYAIQKNMERK